MKKDDFFAVLEEKNESPFIVMDVNVEKIDLFVWRDKGLSYAENWMISRSSL